MNIKNNTVMSSIGVEPFESSRVEFYSILRANTRLHKQSSRASSRVELLIELFELSSFSRVVEFCSSLPRALEFQENEKLDSARLVAIPIGA